MAACQAQCLKSLGHLPVTQCSSPIELSSKQPATVRFDRTLSKHVSPVAFCHSKMNCSTKLHSGLCPTCGTVVIRFLHETSCSSGGVSPTSDGRLAPYERAEIWICLIILPEEWNFCRIWVCIPPIINLGSLSAIAKDRDNEIVRVLKTHPKAIPLS